MVRCECENPWMDYSPSDLAELDEITGNDIVATLARIVTGEAQLETPGLQQAFAEANAGIR
jgi:hypothetical protein